jgi:Family of unknown function (DUF6266)
MGKLLQGINGPFSGKVGTAVGYVWNGVPVIRSRPASRKKPFTEKELNQQARFSYMSKFLVPLKDLLNITFAHLAVRMTGFNKAYSYNVKNALTGFGPDLKIEFSMVLVSRGDIPAAENILVDSPLPGVLQFSWADNSGKGKALGTDKAFAAWFDSESGIWDYALDLATRADGQCQIEIKDSTGKPLQTYLGFLAADGKDASDSVYAGTAESLRNEVSISSFPHINIP